MPTNLPPLRSQLYAPGNKVKLLEKVYTAGADAVILDLEDAVPPSEKGNARSMVEQVVHLHAGKPGPFTFVRINDPSGPLAGEDLKAVVHPGLAGLRLPKVESVEAVRRLADWIEPLEAVAGMPAGSVVFICTIETAAGLYRVFEIASAHPRVVSLSFGATDFARDLGITPGPEELELLHARSQIVLACRVAGIQPPVDTVFTRLEDDAGLERSTRQGKALGFFGRSAIHPRQVPIINSIYTPTEEEVTHAQKIVDAAKDAEAQGTGALKIGQGEFIDVAVVRRAQDVLALASKVKS